MNEMSESIQLNLAVWKKGRKVRGCDPDVWRQTHDGHIIRRDDMGNSDSKYGWDCLTSAPLGQIEVIA